ncbi:phage tail spike protein [Latilactobacillus sakei]|uniref:phage tail spike protein n=1 Tax=Latilactobacillus sakei TaxID=1599 RepID=UPI001BD5BB75|nr:phage tail spike protein [Latilactobacillus sakei]QVQ48489.1 phage tail protein [Latilactobacillus sakei subsp. sakei]
MSVPIIYEANATDFNNLGLGPLVDTTVATVTEERNGQFILEMQYPVEGIRSSLITKNRILKVDAGHKLKDQRFVIKRINRIMGNDGLSYSIYAEHISYITADYALKPNLTVNGSGNVAMTQWLNGIIDSNRIHVDSDITTENTTSWTIDKVQNARQALGGVQGSILDVWGGEYRFDNLNISLLKHRGTVSNTLLSYGRNITDFDQEENITNTYTSIYPFASYSVQNGDTSEQKILTIPDLVVDSEYVNNFPNRKIQVVDFSDKFSTDEKPTVERLAELAKSYIKNNNVGVPTVSTKISFVDLSKTENYKEFAPLEELDLCDEVPFAFEKFGIKTTAKISRIVWNVLLDSYDSLELGELKTNLSDVINNTNNAALDAKDAANDAKNSADNAALSANGKNRNWYGADDPAFGHLSELREGDSWYMPNGEDTELYHWINGQWVFILSTKDTHEAKDAADTAQKEAEEAKTQANKAVDGANDAVAKAGFANDTADQAKSDAASALQKALDAYAHGDQIKTGLTADIDAVKGQVNLKANQVDVDKLGGRVTDAEAQIKLQADQIELTVSKTELTNVLGDYATETWTQSQIKSTADSINLSVSKVQSNLDNLAIGGRNYLADTGSSWQAKGPGGTNQSSSMKWLFTFGAIKQAPFNDGDYVTVSFDYTNVGTGAYGTILPQFNNTPWGQLGGGDAMKGNGHVVRTVQWKSDWTTSGTATGIQIRIDNVATTRTVTAYNMQFERGNKATDYKAAPEDMATVEKLSELQLTVNGIQGTVQNKADQSQVTQLADQITMVVGNSGQVNLAFNSNFESSAGGWNFNKDRWYFSTGIYDVYQGSGSLVYKDYNETGDVWATAFSKSIDVSPGQNISASCQLNRIGNLGAPDGAVYIGVEFYEKEGAPRLSYKTAAMNTASTKWQRLIIDKVTAPDKATIAKLIFQVQKNGWISFSQPMLVKADAVGVYQTNLVSQSQITQLANDINLRVKAGDVVNQINISPESILIAGQKVHITGQTSIDNAVIKDAMIADIKADKITAGTLNAANVNVINLNANNITTGTIKGANLSLNLNTGEVVFQHGRIHSTSNNVDVNIDQGYLSVADSVNRVLLKGGQMQFVAPNLFDNQTNPYLSISNSGGGQGLFGGQIVGRDFLSLANSANNTGFFDNSLGIETFAGISFGKANGTWRPTKIGGADRGIMLVGGASMPSNMFGDSPSIIIGANKNLQTTGNRIVINGEYIHAKSVYEKTSSASANVVVNSDGALVRSTSASKYKTDIIRANATDYGDKLLNLPTATWIDIAETKRYQDNPTTQPKPTRNFGMIAEDLADAGLEMLVVRGTDGELEGINYDRIGPALIPVIAKLKNEVETLKQQLEAETA